MNVKYHAFRHKWNFYRGYFWCLIAVATLVVCALAFRLFTTWPKINPTLSPPTRIITSTVWAGCVHEPERTFTEFIKWKDPKFHLYDFLGIQRKDDSLTHKEWERFTQLYDPTGEIRKINRKWLFYIPGEHQKYRDICELCNESADLFLLGKPISKKLTDQGDGLLTFAAYKPTTNFESDLRWWRGADQILLTMSEDGMHGPYLYLPMLAISPTEQEDLNLHFLRSPYGASTFMNQHTSPIDTLEDALLLKQTFENIMSWEFLEESNDRLEKLIRQGPTLKLGQTSVKPSDLKVEIVKDANGWVFRGPLKISDGKDGQDEIIYHRCALRVRRDGTVSFQHLKELVERYPAYQ